MSWKFSWADLLLFGGGSLFVLGVINKENLILAVFGLLFIQGWTIKYTVRWLEQLSLSKESDKGDVNE